MKKLRYISFILALLVCSCQQFDEQTDSYSVDADGSSVSSVTLLEDGRLSVALSLGTTSMTSVDVGTRAAANYEDVIYSGWCLIFGEDATERSIDGAQYTDASPLLMKIPIEVNANGTFFIKINPYEGASFLRIVANMTDREELTLSKTVAWGDDPENYYTVDTGDGYTVEYLKTYDYSVSCATFGDYKYQSVGLDGIYDVEYSATTTSTYEVDDNGVESLVYDNINETQPDPSNLSSSIPMSSIGFVFDAGITVSSLEDMFTNTIYMVRVCSKMDVTVTDSSFALSEIYMIECAQESRIRSTVLDAMQSCAYTSIAPTFSVPINLGGTIDYLPLVENVTSGGTSSPIYFYPNSGGDYDDNDGAVDQDINPQYVIVKGRAGGYDTDGYYKIALKAQYPLEYNYDNDGNLIDVKTWSDVTYDILRNTHFNIDLLGVDNPGYKTLEDASNPSNPASNISYNLTILATDGRNEILMSNGTYYVELSTTRIYSKGFAYEEGVEGELTFTLYPNSSNDGYQHPNVYVMSDFGVEITGVKYTQNGSETTVVKDELSDDEIKTFYGESTSVNDDCYLVPESTLETKVTLTYKARASGRIRLRIGDILKFIPLAYETDPKTYTSGEVEISGVSNFAYDENASTINYYNYNDGWVSSPNSVWFQNDGSVLTNYQEYERMFDALIYPLNADGVTKLYLKQAAFNDPDAGSDDNTIDFNVYYKDLESGVHYSYYTNIDDIPTGHRIYIKTYFPEFIDGLNEYGDFTTEVVIGGVTQTYLPTYYLVAAKMMYLLDQGYTTLYFSNDYHSLFMFEDGWIALESVFDLLKEFVDERIENGEYDSDYTYGLDLSEATFSITWFDSKYFGNNTYLKSIILPQGVQYLIDGTFQGCTNLTYIRIGEEDTPADFVGINTDDVFSGCNNLEQVIIYSTNNTVAYFGSEITSSNSYSAFMNSSITTSSYVMTESSTDGGESKVYIHNWTNGQ